MLINLTSTKFIALAFAGLFLLASIFLALPVSAQTKAEVCEGVSITGGEGDACARGNPQDEVGGTVKKALDIFSMAVGIISVAMIMFSGFRYITAGGDSSKINTAQQTIIYAIVGLVIAGLAQVIIRFVVAIAS